MLLIIIIVFLLLFAIGGLPNLGYHNYGWGPSGIVAIILVILVVLLLTGRL